jgi:hypothetical protein
MLWGLLAVALAPGSSWSGPGAKTPRLNLRATPRFALAAPANVFLTAELIGGDEVEDYYCPALEWDWGDGSRSVRESDCPPMEAGVAFERRFTAEHIYRGSGTYNIRVTLRRVARPIAVASASVTVH